MTPEHRLTPAQLARLLHGWTRGTTTTSRLRPQGEAAPALPEHPGRGAATYLALAGAVRTAVVSGAVPVHTRLPSERALAEALKLSRTTVAGAYDLLRGEGYLVSVRGSGTRTALPAGAQGDARALSFELPADDRLLDLAVAAPVAPAGLAAVVAQAAVDLGHHLGSRGYEPFGLAVLRAAIAEHYRRRGVPTDPEQILVTSGAQQAITLLVGAHVGPGDRIVVEHPTYPHAAAVARDRGARPVPVALGPAGLRADALATALRRSGARVAYLVPDHHNPTGTSLDAATRAQVRQAARRSDTLVIADEVCCDLTLDGAPPLPLEAADARHVVAVGSASKICWGGLRVGWLRAEPELVERLARLRHRSDISTAVLDQLVVARLLNEGQGLLAARLDELRAGRDLLVALLRDHLPTWRFVVPAGGLSLWIDLGRPVATRLALVAAAHGVRVVPGTVFGLDGAFEDHLRLPWSAPSAVLEAAVPALAAAWAGLEDAPAGPSRRFEAIV